MHFFCMLALLSLSVLPIQAKIIWHTDYAKVRNISQEEDKPILLFFNGSDWAGSAMKLKHEILNSPIFQEIISDKLVCIEADFPKHISPVDKLVMQNEVLKKKFKVQDPPLILLLDSQERIIAQVDYLPENDEKFASALLKILEQDAELQSNLQHIRSATPPQLKKLYQLAQELSNEAAVEQILAIGLKKEDPFFYLEKYRQLVENGKMHSKEAQNLRQKLIAIGPESDQINGQFIPFTLALIDFQELVSVSCEPEIIAQPLLDYLHNFGSKDQKNIWRIEMMIAEVYLDADKWEEALKHAEKAYQTAPTAMHEEIAHSLNYIRSQNFQR